MSQDTLHSTLTATAHKGTQSLSAPKHLAAKKNLSDTSLNKNSLLTSRINDSLNTYQPVVEDTVFHFTDLDTIRTSANENSDITVNFFTDHSSSVIHPAPESINRVVPDWFTVILLLIVFGLTWIKVFYARIFKHLRDAFFSNLVAYQVVRDENILVQRASVLLSVIFYLGAALFIYQITVSFNFNAQIIGSGFGRFIILSFVVAFAYSFKMILLKLSGFIFDADRPAAIYIFNIFLINNAIGLLLIPAVALIAYLPLSTSKYVMTVTVILVVLSFLYRLFRGFSVGLTQGRFSFLHLFLYLCAFEIAPVLLFYKFIAG